MSIPKLLEQLAEARAARQELGAKFGEAKEKEEQLKTEVQKTLQEVGLKSAKTEDGIYSASVTNRESIKVVDHKAAIDWLKQQGLDVDFYTQVDSKKFKQIAESALKETGELVPGAELSQSEYLNFRENKGKQDKQPDAEQQNA